MVGEPCCRLEGRGSQGFARGGRAAAGWMAPVLSGAALVLMPKCPACFAAYVAMGTGIGLSVPAASWLRLGLLILCLGSLSFLVARFAQRLMTRRARRGEARDADSTRFSPGRCRSSSCHTSQHTDAPAPGRREQES